MSKTGYIGLVTVAATLLTLSAPGSVRAQTTEPPVSQPSVDTVFEEIQLSEEGVIAVDTSGREWYYNFETNTFVQGSLPDDRHPDVQREWADSRMDETPIEERCTEEKKVEPLDRKITVRENEYVDGDIIAWDVVTVKGWVKGNVKAIRKRVLVTESGRVDGDIEAPRVIIKDGAEIRGEVSEVGSPLELEDITQSFSADGLIIVLSFTLALLFFGFLTVSLMPRQMRNIDVCLGSYKLKSFFLGLLFMVLMPALMALLLITIVGIIFTPLVPLLYLVAIGMGIVTFGNRLGRQFSTRYLGRERSMLLQSVLGLTLLMSLWFIVAILLGAGDDVSRGFGIFFLVVSILLTSFPVLAGVGAAVLTRFGFRECKTWDSQAGYAGTSQAPMPAPPPIPHSPELEPSPDENQPPPATPPSSPRIPDQEN
ncbi:MAG: polymer-forming cytoskeletal protein [bacterium]